MNNIKIGVVGLGHRGRHMLKLTKAFDFVEQTAACDINPDCWFKPQWDQAPMVEDFSETLFFDNYGKMLAEANLDLVIVETGADVHAEFCRLALAKDINVLSDIPLVANLDETDSLWKTAEKSSAEIMTGANPNEWGFVNAFVDLYKKGLLGKPYYMEAEYIHCFSENEKKQLFESSPWRKKFAPIQYCTHSLGPLLRILKEDFRYVSCFGTGAHFTPPGERDDMMTAHFKTESGVVVRLLRNGDCAAKIGHHSYRIFGTEGYFERCSGYGGKPLVRFNSKKLYGAMQLTELPVDMMPHQYVGNPNAAGHGGADYAILDKFFKALRKGNKAPIPLHEGLRMTLPGIYAAESARRNGDVLIIRYPWEKEWKTTF